MNKRIEWIDLCKAIGIYLVVLGHFLPVGTPLKIIIYSFHVPLFFILSGFLLKTERGWVSQVFRRARLLLLPYFGFATVSLFYYVAFPINKMDIVTKFFFWKGETVWNEPLWFLFTLFVVELIAYTLFRCLPIFTKNMTALFGIVIGVMAMGYFVYWLRPLSLEYFGIDKAICLLGFYLLGYLLRQTQFLNALPKSKELWTGVFLLVCVITLVLNWNNNISVYYLDLNNYFVFLFTSIIGSISLIALCQNVSVEKFLKSVSNHTIFIMGTHYVFLLLYIWVADRIPMDSMIFCLPVLVIYTIALYWWDKRRTLIKSQ